MRQQFYSSKKQNGRKVSLDTQNPSMLIEHNTNRESNSLSPRNRQISGIEFTSLNNTSDRMTMRPQNAS
jgi:hypothetical protein